MKWNDAMFFLETIWLLKINQWSPLASRCFPFHCWKIQCVALENFFYQQWSPPLRLFCVNDGFPTVSHFLSRRRFHVLVQFRIFCRNDGFTFFVPMTVSCFLSSCACFSRNNGFTLFCRQWWFHHSANRKHVFVPRTRSKKQNPSWFVLQNAYFLWTFLLQQLQLCLHSRWKIDSARSLPSPQRSSSLYISNGRSAALNPANKKWLKHAQKNWSTFFADVFSEIFRS